MWKWPLLLIFRRNMLPSGLKWLAWAYRDKSKVSVRTIGWVPWFLVGCHFAYITWSYLHLIMSTLKMEATYSTECHHPGMWLTKSVNLVATREFCIAQFRGQWPITNMLIITTSICYICLWRRWVINNCCKYHFTSLFAVSSQSLVCCSAFFILPLSFLFQGTVNYFFHRFTN